MSEGPRIEPSERIHTTWLHSSRTVPARFIRPVLRFTHIESAGGIVLLVAAVAALVWANAPFGESYEHFWETHMEFSLGPLHLDESLRHFVNDGLMAIFFFVVGLEIKRELVLGELRDPKAAALPAFAALGGMIFPATIYLLIVGGGDASSGWGIPMATDIAFSVGIISLLGRRVPVGAKLFLLALAIVDDIGAIAVIAVFYTEQLFFGWFGASIATLALIWLAQRIGIRSVPVYALLAGFAWLFLLESGVHATLAGVAVGFLTPAGSMYSDREYHEKASRLLDRYDFDAAAPHGTERVDHDALEVAAVARESVSPLQRAENALHPWSSFLIVPIFALANAGVRFAGVDILEAATSSVALGVAVGLVVGKFVGISIFTWLAVRLGLGRLPRGTGWVHVGGLALIAGIGFTVSLFVTSLAFSDPGITDLAKTGIFVGSTIAGVAGYAMLRTVKDPSTATEPKPTAEPAIDSAPAS
jgi:NhaA family Na+:H+ antiporter